MTSSLPANILLRYQPLLDAQEFNRMLEELQRPLLPALRINPLKVNPQAALTDWVQRYGWQVHPVPYCPTGWQVNASQTPISRTIEHRLGQYYIQDAASMLPVELFDLNEQAEPLVLDLAASPGGKTTHLAARIGDRGLVLANDSAQSRITALRLVLQTWGAASSAVTCFPGENFGAWFPETFDRVLLDAPCSMENLRPSESHPMRPISAKERLLLADRQVRLLASALQALKVGGQLVYSTCTLAPEEDEAVLDALLRQYPAAVQVENLSRRLPWPAPALESDSHQRFHPAVVNAARLWPHCFGTSGFFAALLTKLAPVRAPLSHPPSRPLSKTNLQPLSREENLTLAQQWRTEYGFDLETVQANQRLALWRHNRQIYALPELFLRYFAELPFQAVGLLLGEEASGRVIPSHEWVARYAARFSAGRYRLPGELLPAWLRGEDLHGLTPRGFRPSQVVIVEDEDGRLLGRGRVLADRLKNLLPRRLAV